MPTNDYHASGLFKSLGADDGEFQASGKNAARDAAYRWPLLKTIEPVTPAVAPALQEHEKQQRNAADTHPPSVRKPALTLSGLGDKLAQSLGKMSAPRASDGASARVRDAVPGERHAAPRGTDTLAPPSPAATGRTLFSRTAAAVAVVAPVSERAGPARSGLFAKAQPESRSARMPAQDKSLAGIFSRLDGDAEPASTGRGASFLGRTVKR